MRGESPAPLMAAAALLAANTKLVSRTTPGPKALKARTAKTRQAAVPLTAKPVGSKSQLCMPR